MGRTKIRKVVLSLLVILLIGESFAIAETIRGTLVALDPEEQSVGVMISGDFTGQRRPLKLVVSKNADFKGCGALTDLEIGDKVRINGIQNRDNGLWEAQSIELFRRTGSKSNGKS